MHAVYWIKRKDHTDIFTEGYVGYSSQPHERFEAHKCAKSVVGNNVRKYQNLVEFIIVKTFDIKEEALKYEKELRPQKRIGWNLAIGGQVPPNNKNKEDVKKKISNTIKALGMNPYSKKTHSKESIEKALAKKQQANRKMYHDPITGEYKFIALGLGEKIPDGWVRGRVKRIIIKKMQRGVDYVCNTKNFIVTDPNGVEYNVTNLKQWCLDMKIPYLAACKKKSWKGWNVK